MPQDMGFINQTPIAPIFTHDNEVYYDTVDPDHDFTHVIYKSADGKQSMFIDAKLMEDADAIFDNWEYELDFIDTLVKF